jgi:hypothetical protein
MPGLHGAINRFFPMHPINWCTDNVDIRYGRVPPFRISLFPTLCQISVLGRMPLAFLWTTSCPILFSGVHVIQVLDYQMILINFKLVTSRLVLRAITFTAAAWSKTWNVFGRSDAAIVGSNPTQGMDVWCIRLLCVCVVLCFGSGIATGWSLVQGVLQSVKNDYGTE